MDSLLRHFYHLKINSTNLVSLRTIVLLVIGIFIVVVFYFLIYIFWYCVLSFYLKHKHNYMKFLKIKIWKCNFHYILTASFILKTLYPKRSSRFYKTNVYLYLKTFLQLINLKSRVFLLSRFLYKVFQPLQLTMTWLLQKSLNSLSAS